MEYREHILWYETRAFVIHYHVIFVEFHQPPRLSTYKLPPRWIGVTMQTLFQTRLETRCQFIGRLGRLYALHIFVVAGVWLYIAYFYNTAVLCDAVNPGSRETVRLGKNVTLLWRHDGDDSVLNQQPCSTVYSDADQRKHQSSASLAFVRGIHRGPVNSPHKWPVTRKMFPFDDVIMKPMSIRNLLLGSTTGFFSRSDRVSSLHDGVTKWKYFPRYWPFVKSLVDSPHKSQWRAALMYSLIWTNGSANNPGTGDLSRHCAHYDVIIMVDGLGVSKPFFSSPLVFFYIFQIGQNTGYIWNIVFTSDRCRRNLAAVTSVNYGCDFKNLTCTYKTTAMSPKGKWLQIFWYSVMAKQMTKLIKLTFHKFHQKVQ